MPFPLALCWAAATAACAYTLWTVAVPFLFRDKVGGLAVSERDLRLASAEAWRRMRGRVLVGFLLMTYLHSYARAEDALLAERAAAMSLPPPFQCGDDGVAPRTEYAGYGEAAMHTLYPHSFHEACAEWHRKRHASTWPNPLQVLLDILFLDAMLRSIDNVADGVGRSLSHFLGHLGLTDRVFLVGVVVVFVLLATVLRPFHALITDAFNAAGATPQLEGWEARGCQ